MPSTTRGSILISTANDIGEALVEKLGGVGYSPNEWKEKYNLCGIAPVDSAPALSVLSDSAGTGDERGSILIATADAIGAILNKKYNVLRGFKPKEWASACRKMKALEEGSVASASIASFSDGADTVPLTSCVCSIDANLDGKTAVNAVHARKNLFNVADYSQIYTDRDGVDSYNYRYMIIQLKPNTTYTISQYAGTPIILINNALPVGGTNYFDLRKANDTKTYTTDSTGRLYIGSINSYDDVAYARLQVCNVQIEVGSTATAYEPYQTPETKTADLGRAVYGGSADIIKGEGKSTRIKKIVKWGDLGNSTQLADVTRKEIVLSASEEPKYITASASTDLLNDKNLPYDMTYSGNFEHIYIANASRIWIYLANGTDADTEIAVSYTLTDALQTDFTFEPVKIDSFPGVNNIWNDCGNTAVEYYQAPTPYARKTATGGIANFSDQRTDLPLTKAIANITPSIAGKSAVNLYQGKKNLLKLSDGEYNIGNTGAIVTISSGELNVSGTTVNSGGRTTRLSDYFIIKAGTYFLSPVIGTSPYVRSYLNKKSDNSVVGYSSGYSFTVTEETEVYFGVNLENGYTYDATLTPQLEVGSTASSFVPYQDPTTYTAELGETVYGGSVDFVSGEVQKTWGAPFTWTSGMSGVSVNANGVCYINKSDVVTVNASNQTTLVGCKCSDSSFESRTWAGLQNSSTNGCACVYGNGIAIRIAGYTTKEEYETYLSSNPLTFVYVVKEPTESAIPGRVISPIEGVNNYWNDAGGDTEIEYFEDEA